MPNHDMVNLALRTGFARALIGDDLKHSQIIEANYLPDGRMRTEVAQTVIPLIPISWSLTTLTAGQLTQRHELPQPGTVERLAAMVTTPPSGGDLVVILTGQSAMTTVFEIARVTIPDGRYSERIQITPPQPLPAGTWLGIQLGSPNSAAGLSVTVAFRGEA